MSTRSLSSYTAVLVTPIKKQPVVDRAESDRLFNTELTKIRVAVEGANAHLKNWRILASRHRASLHRMAEVVTVVTGLVMLNEQHTLCQLSFTRISQVEISE